MSTDVIIEKYIQLRDKKAALKAEFDGKVAPVDEAMARIEAYMMKVLTDLGSDRIGGATGVAFKSTVNSATVADKELFREFVRANDAWELADIRAQKTAIKDYIEQHDDLPPGINWRTETVVRINRP